VHWYCQGFLPATLPAGSTRRIWASWTHLLCCLQMSKLRLYTMATLVHIGSTKFGWLWGAAGESGKFRIFEKITDFSDNLNKIFKFFS
jgi:hypothetical protein